MITDRETLRRHPEHGRFRAMRRGGLHHGPNPFLARLRPSQPPSRLVQSVRNLAARPAHPIVNRRRQALVEAILNIGKPLLEDLIKPFPPAGFQFLSNAIDLQLPGCRDLLAGERLRFRRSLL